MVPDFSKYSDGLVPVIVQDNNTGKVLMLGFMNEEAFTQTQKEGKVLFCSSPDIGNESIFHLRHIGCIAR